MSMKVLNGFSRSVAKDVILQCNPNARPRIHCALMRSDTATVK